MPADNGSITDRIPHLRAGDPEAIRQVFDRYFGAMVQLAQKKIMGLPGWTTDGEDVALSAFKSFCRALAGDQFPAVDDRHALWQVLLVILHRKACDHLKHVHRQRRGGRATHVPIAEDIQAVQPTPEQQAAIADTMRTLIDQLDEPLLQNIALLKLADHTNADIAQQLGCGLRSVERKLERIRRIWSERGLP